MHHSQERPFQAYAILTMCRALYAVQNGRQASKKQAAEWTQEQLPEWSEFIANALYWRQGWREQGIDHAANFPETVRFVEAVRERILSDGG